MSSKKTCPFLNKICINEDCGVFRVTKDGGECALLAAGNYAGDVRLHTLEMFKQLGGEVTINDKGGAHLEAKPERLTND